MVCRRRRLRGTCAAAVATALLLGGLGMGDLAHAGPTGGALNKAYELWLAVTAHEAVPDDAVAAVLNVTAVDAQRAGYLTVYPCGQPEPLASNLNYTAGPGAVPNAVVAGIGEDGSVCLVSMSTVDVVIDLVGYVPAGSPLTPLAAPRRLLDTRDGNGAAAGVTGPGVLALQVAGREGIPTGTAAVVVNTTVVTPAGPGFVTVFPCDQPIPQASNVNFVAGDIRPNLVIARLDVLGRACFYSNQPTHLVVDAIAHLPSGSTGYTAIDNPQRLLDSRTGAGPRRRGGSGRRGSGCGSVGGPACRRTRRRRCST